MTVRAVVECAEAGGQQDGTGQGDEQAQRGAREWRAPRSACPPPGAGGGTSVIPASDRC